MNLSHRTLKDTFKVAIIFNDFSTLKLQQVKCDSFSQAKPFRVITKIIHLMSSPIFTRTHLQLKMKYFKST